MTDLAPRQPDATPAVMDDKERHRPVRWELDR